MQTRRSFLGSLPITPVAAAMAKPAGPAIGQPTPVLTMVADMDGRTAISRTWTEADTRRCRLCDSCDARPAGRGLAVCMIITDQHVRDEDADLYSIRGFDLT